MDLSFKWQKILLLHCFNLMTSDEIMQQVHRFSWKDVTKLVNDIELDIKSNLKNNIECVYTVVLVPTHQRFKLPNYLVKGLADLVGIDNFIRKNSKENYAELWYFKKQSNPLNQACGRILFLDNSMNSQVVEVTDGDSVRNIETDKFDTLYFRADRINWGFSYKIIKSCLCASEIESAKHVVARIFISIERLRHDVECLSIFFNSLGISNFSLDFLLIGDSFKIIDWDTENDRKVFDFLKCNSSILAQWKF